MKKFLRYFFSAIIAGGLFYYVIKDYDLYSLISVIKDVKPWYVFFGIITMSGMYVLGGIRWKYLYPKYTLKQSIDGVIVAVAANTIIPMRGGELVRALFLSKKAGGQVSELFGKIIIERTTDIISLLVLLFMSGAVLGEVVRDESRYILALGIMACSIIYLFIGIYKHCHIAIDNKISKIEFENRAFSFIKEKVLAMLIPFKKVPFHSVFIAQMVSFTIIFSGILLLFFFLLASNIQINFLSVMAIFPLVVLSISLPVTIGHVGVYHAALIIALSYVGVDDPDLVGKVILVHLFTVVPPLVYGCFLVLTTNFKIKNY